MTKAIAEQSNSLSIFWLKKKGCLIPRRLGGGVRSGTLSWTLGMSKSSIGYTLSTSSDGMNDNIRLYYTHTDRYSGKKEEMNYKVPLITTPCNYGGVRYWFKCPLNKNGQYCGRRVGVLYSAGKYFGCRKCADIAYYAQMEGGIYRVGSNSMRDIDEARAKIKRFYYKGKPTRKYRRLLRKEHRFDLGFFQIAAHLDKKYKKI